MLVINTYLLPQVEAVYCTILNLPLHWAYVHKIEGSGYEMFNDVNEFILAEAQAWLL